MFNPTQNLANQLANPYTYQPPQSGGLLTTSPSGNPVITQGWGGHEFDAPPAADPAPVTPPAGLLTEKTGGSANSASAAQTIPTGTAPPTTAPPTTTKNGTGDAGVAPPTLSPTDKSVPAVKLNTPLTTPPTAESLASLSSKDFDIDGFLSANKGIKWSQVGVAALVGGLSAGLPGALVGALGKGIQEYFGDKTVSPADRDKLAAEIDRQLSEDRVNRGFGEMTNPNAPPVTLNDGTPLTLPARYDDTTLAVDDETVPSVVNDYFTFNPQNALNEYLNKYSPEALAEQNKIAQSVEAGKNHDYSGNPDYDASAAGPYGSSAEGASDPW